MAFKYIIASVLLVAVANAAVQPIVYKTKYSPIILQSKHIEGGHYEDEHSAPARYSFAYDVHDAHTGDIKSQQETREGDKVEGYYSLVEPDGSKRTVKYTADEHSGFNAVVEREAAHIPVKTIKPIVVHQEPVYTYHAKPEAYLETSHFAHHEPLTYSYHH